MEIFASTNNKHKLEEITALLDQRIQLRTLRELGCTEELAEDFDTLEKNSLQKAEYVATKYGVDTFADDSGLEVDVLNGRPGADSAHYAGPQRNADDNINLLLRNLGENPNRKARFRTVITLILKKKIYQFEGIVNGTILSERRGTGGFGYDPVFLPDGSSRTMAEMSMEEKNQISHRSIAVRKLANFLNTQS